MAYAQSASMSPQESQVLLCGSNGSCVIHPSRLGICQDTFAQCVPVRALASEGLCMRHIRRKAFRLSLWCALLYTETHFHLSHQCSSNSDRLELRQRHPRYPE